MTIGPQTTTRCNAPHQTHVGQRSNKHAAVQQAPDTMTSPKYSTRNDTTTDMQPKEHSLAASALKNDHGSIAKTKRQHNVTNMMCNTPTCIQEFKKHTMKSSEAQNVDKQCVSTVVMHDIKHSLAARTLRNDHCSKNDKQKQRASSNTCGAT